MRYGYGGDAWPYFWPCFPSLFRREQPSAFQCLIRQYCVMPPMQYLSFPWIWRWNIFHPDLCIWSGIWSIVHRGPEWGHSLSSLSGTNFSGLVHIEPRVWSKFHQEMKANDLFSDHALSTARVDYGQVDNLLYWSGYRLLLLRECSSHCHNVLSNVRTNVRKYVVTWLKHSRECNRPVPGPTDNWHGSSMVKGSFNVKLSLTSNRSERVELKFPRFRISQNEQSCFEATLCSSIRFQS